jgi:catechol 2,3-dioxygenase-like lactoylglutathione lyase family enzyme
MQQVFPAVSVYPNTGKAHGDDGSARTHYLTCRVDAAEHISPSLLSMRRPAEVRGTAAQPGPLAEGGSKMTQLNHINLGVSNVPELVRFFQSGFGFRIEETRGTDKFAVLLGEDGFVLILMHDKNVADDTYPALFHIGFLMHSYEEVRETHQRIVDAGFEAPLPAILHRGGDKTFGFYAKPHGVMVEVSCPAE